MKRTILKMNWEKGETGLQLNKALHMLNSLSMVANDGQKGVGGTLSITNY